MRISMHKSNSETENKGIVRLNSSFYSELKVKASWNELRYAMSWSISTNAGQYLRAEVDGGFGQDVMEFLVNGDVVSYRAMATKVTYVYPFTTALGDSKSQEARLKQIIDEIGWYAPSFDSMD